jgi:hypothetical protein
MLNREAASDRHDDQSCYIKFPESWPKPRFHLGQKVWPNRAGDRLFVFGHVVGIVYAECNHLWICEVQLSCHCDLLSNTDLPQYPVQKYSQGELSAFD